MLVSGTLPLLICLRTLLCQVLSNLFLTWITTFAQLAIVFAILTSKRNLVPYGVPFLWVSIYLNCQRTQLVQRQTP